MKKVAIQGIAGSFHHTASDNYFGYDMEIYPCMTFDEVIYSVENGMCDYGIMAVENTISGSLLPNYSLIIDSNLHITGEIFLRIEQNLMALHGQSIEDIKTVYSHPVALAQCRDFFSDKPWIKLVEAEDTALSAKLITDNNMLNIAAIASITAAELYKLSILAKSIETNKVNFTRFWIIEKNANILDINGLNKASLCFTLKHETGKLAQALSILSFYGLNLTKIQSLPIIGKEWQYKFFVDVLFPDYHTYDDAISALKPLTETFKCLGVYKEGVRVGI